MEHGRQDEDPLARALRALGTSDPGVDVVALTAGARGRARTGGGGGRGGGGAGGGGGRGGGGGGGGRPG
ncbi:hypothetical protein, partial [Kineococcus esterisolvens]|uniref:hypothetical protein n=1 Tax=Kineococcus sp. SYSU DK029 TaxID=3383150 RepID=UPI003D7DA035